MSRRDPLLRAAGLILARLKRPRTTNFLTDHAIQDRIQLQRMLERTFRQLQKAQGRGWQAAAAIKRSQLLEMARQVERLAGDSLRHQSSPPPEQQFPKLADILADLRQLEDEFEAVVLRLREGVVAVNTGPITLEDVELGPFAIELHLTRLSTQDSSSFKCVALKPNRAETDSNVTHPHVSNDSLCAGDATTPLSAALQEGRIADAFCLVNAVLHGYNAGSAYVSLDGWNGVRCGDCDRMTSSDNLYACEECGRDCCDSCNRTCDGCENRFCDNCLQRDEDAEEYFCGKCRRSCPSCHRILGNKHCDETTGLCRSCNEAEQDDSTPDDLTEVPDENEEQAAPTPVAAAG